MSTVAGATRGLVTALAPGDMVTVPLLHTLVLTMLHKPSKQSYRMVARTVLQEVGAGRLDPHGLEGKAIRYKRSKV